MERLFDATPLWALSQPEEKLEANPAFWRVLGPPTHPVGKCRSDLPPSAGESARRRRACRREAARFCGGMARQGWSLTAGRVDEFTPVRSAHECDPRHARAGKLRRAFRAIPAARTIVCSMPLPRWRPVRSLPKERSADVLGDVPGICDAALDRPCAKARHKRAALTRQTENEAERQQRPRRGMRCQRPNACSSNRSLEPGANSRSTSLIQAATMSVLAAPFDKHQSDRARRLP